MKNTLETSGEDVKLHSRRVEKMYNHTRDECVFSIRIHTLTDGRDVPSLSSLDYIARLEKHISTLNGDSPIRL